MIFGFLKLFRGLGFYIVPMQPVYHTEMRSVGHAAQPKCSNKVRRPDQDDYG